MTTRTHRITVDDTGRLLIPDAIRKQFVIKAGDVFLLRSDDCGGLHFAREENPFDLLAEHALREHRAGKTIRLRDIAAEEGIDLDSAAPD
jgi:bifunctional DNA-binding transcriptional regulator/antitoxin component of YhaV-PrlF toxin-antitoxin module